MIEPQYFEDRPTWTCQGCGDEIDGGIGCATCEEKILAKASGNGKPADSSREVAFWFPVKRGARKLPADHRKNGSGLEMPIYAAKVTEWSEAFGGAEVEPEIRNCLRWNRDNPGRQKTPTGLHRHIGAWLAKANDGGKFNGGSPARRWKGESLPAGPDSSGEARGITM